MIKIFIVDDHYMVIEGLRTMLQEVEWMGQAMTAASCLAFLKGHQPDVILMDIHLPDMSGIELCKLVKEMYPGVFVIGLSTFNQYSFIQKMMEHGASGYVLKNATKEELMEAFEVVMRGKEYLSDEVGKMMLQPEKEGIVLTRREVEVLGLIAEGLTNQEIGEKLFVSSTTIITHRKNLMAKFGAKNTAILVKMAVQMGVI